jgi:hypothetical protein
MQSGEVRTHREYAGLIFPRPFYFWANVSELLSQLFIYLFITKKPMTFYQVLNQRN